MMNHVPKHMVLNINDRNSSVLGYNQALVIESAWPKVCATRSIASYLSVDLAN